jgi:hypothetical protein
MDNTSVLLRSNSNPLNSLTAIAAKYSVATKRLIVVAVKVD